MRTEEKRGPRIAGDSNSAKSLPRERTLVRIIGGPSAESEKRSEDQLEPGSPQEKFHLRKSVISIKVAEIIPVNLTFVIETRPAEVSSPPIHPEQRSSSGEFSVTEEP